ncbi:MAG: hypothetical protein QM681_00735 [Novosphingobium sp.]
MATIRKAKQFIVGVVAGTPQTPETQGLLVAIERQTGARPQIAYGAADTLLAELSEGKSDLVLGAFEKDSPWKTEVAFAPALSSTKIGNGIIEVKAAMRNGENSWIMLVERASRSVSKKAGNQ